MKYGFGIDLGGTTVKLAYFDQNGNMLDKWEIPTNTAEDGKYILPDIAAAILKYMEEKNFSKCYRPTQGLPQIPLRAANCLKAICRPPMGT